MLLDQFELPRSHPLLQLFLSANRLKDVVVDFIPHEVVNLVWYESCGQCRLSCRRRVCHFACSPGCTQSNSWGNAREVFYWSWFVRSPDSRVGLRAYVALRSGLPMKTFGSDNRPLSRPHVLSRLVTPTRLKPACHTHTSSVGVQNDALSKPRALAILWLDSR